MKIISLLMLCSLFSSVEAQGTFHGDNARTGRYLSPSLRSAPVVKWRFKADGPILGSAALSNGVLFFGSNDGKLYAIEEASGKLKWKFGAGGVISSSPAVSAGLVFFTSFDGNVYAVNEEKGTLSWKYPMRFERHFEAKNLHGQFPKAQTMPDVWDFFTSSPAVENDRVFVGSGDGNVYSLDAKTGRLIWKLHTSEVIHGSPAIGGGTVYIGGFDSRLYAINANDGKVKWVFQAGIDPDRHNQVGFQGSPCVADGMVYIGCRDHHIYSVDAGTGRRKWAFATDGTGWASNTPACFGSGVFAGTSPLNRLEAADGGLVFKLTGLNGIFSSPAITGDTLYFGSLSGSLYGVDTQSGAILWQFQSDAAQANSMGSLTPEGKLNPKAFEATYFDFEDDYVLMYKRFSLGSFVASPLVDQGTLFIGSADGTFYAVGA